MAIIDLGPCRILHLIGQLGWGGSERQLSYLLRELDRKRYPSHVLVWNYSPAQRYVDEIGSLGVPIHFFPQGMSSVAKLQRMRRLVQALGAEIIHSCSFYTNFPAFWAALGTKAIAIGSIRGNFNDLKRASGLLRGLLSARWPRYQISNSFSSAEEARRSSSIFSPKHIGVVRNGLDLRLFCVAEGNALVKESIVGVGSLLSYKRWDRVLRIVHEVRRRGAECSLRLAGEGPERKSLERQAEDLGISDRVEFISTTPDVPGLLGKSRFLVHTSDTEGCPNVVMEAMACGRPVVAMDAGDIPFLVEDGKSGFVISLGDESMFADRVFQLLADDELCRHMGLAARAKAEKEFGLTSLVDETLNAYKVAGWRDA